MDGIHRLSISYQTSRVQSEGRVSSSHISLSLSPFPTLRSHTRLSMLSSAIIVNSNDRVIRLLSLSPFPPPPPSPPSPASPSSNPDKLMQEDDNEEPSATAAEPYSPPPPRPARIPYFEIVHKFQDLVNRTPWNGCGFSNDGEHIMGGESSFLFPFLSDL